MSHLCKPEAYSRRPSLLIMQEESKLTQGIPAPIPLPDAEARPKYHQRELATSFVYLLKPLSAMAKDRPATREGRGGAGSNELNTGQIVPRQKCEEGGHISSSSSPFIPHLSTVGDQVSPYQ